MQPQGYMLEWKPGDYCFYSPGLFEKETQRRSARITPLYDAPQYGCSAMPVVYKGSYWVQPKYCFKTQGECPDGFVPMYAGHSYYEMYPFRAIG